MFCEEDTELMVLSRDGFNSIMKLALGINILFTLLLNNLYKYR